MSYVTKASLAAPLVLSFLWAGTASAQATAGATVTTEGAAATTNVDTGTVEQPDLGDPGCFVIDQVSGFRSRVGGGVQYYGPIGAAYSNFSTELAPQITLSATNPSITTTETTTKSYSLWLAPSLDYFIAPNISVGGLFAVDTSFGSAESKTTVQTTSGIQPAQKGKTDLPTVTAFTIMPRVGYLLRINDRLSIWPRVGIGYFSGSNVIVTTTTSGTSTNVLAEKTTVSSLVMQLDVGIVYQITDNVFFRVAPAVSFSTNGSGKVTYEGKDQSSKTPPDGSGNGSAFAIELSSGFGANFSL
jgi:hypothetical protein